MNDDELRTRIDARLASGQLQRSYPAIAKPLRPGETTPEAFTIGSALADACAVCDERATQFRYNVTPGGPVAFHTRCQKIWEEEAAKPALRK